MLTVIKLIILTIFMVLSSKSIGELILEKLNKKTEETLGIGFLANLSLFWIIEFFVMFFKLSSLYLNIFGGIYLAISVFIIGRNIIKYKKITFTKKEIIAIIIAIVLMVLYCFFVHFGYIETYDSYFYSVLTNSASNASNVSVIDPYTGQENLQNYYKYISYYYQATFLGNALGIENTYLVLAWVMTFMNYLFIAITGLTVVRITKNKYINNILSAFLFTFLTSIFRAPFNALHLVTMIIPIYCFKYMFDLFERDKSSLLLLVITVISTITISSTSLFVILPFIYVFFVVASILKRKDMYKSLLLAITPVIILAFSYIYESLDSYLPMALMMFILTCLYLACMNEKILKALFMLGKLSVIAVFALLVIIGNTGLTSKMKKSFIKSDSVDEGNLIVLEENEEIDKITYENKDLKLDYEFNEEKHSSSMQYIYANNQSSISKIFVLITHSTILYGGMLSLFIYGILKKEKRPEFIAFYIYLIVFYNPLVKKGLSEIALNLEARIYLFFNTIFALYGIKYLIEYLDSKMENKKWHEIIKKYGSYVYAILVGISITAYILNFNLIDANRYNLIYKVPKTVINANEFLEQYIEEENKEGNARVFYTANTFNMSMIDKKVNEKIKIINSKEFMGYFENSEEVITDKLVISAFFDTEAQAKIRNEKNEESYIDEARVRELIKYFNIQYMAIKKPQSDSFKKYIEENYQTIYCNDDIQILKVV